VSPAAAMLVRLRAKIEDVRYTVDVLLTPSRSVSLAQTKLDEAELWLARACAEQEPDEEPTPVGAGRCDECGALLPFHFDSCSESGASERCGRCDHRGTDHYGLDENSPRPCNHTACECAGWKE
jgi:hypothetical protein